MSWRGMLRKAGAGVTVRSGGIRDINFDGRVTSHNIFDNPRFHLYVDGNNGDDDANGLSYERAFATIQAACTIANSAAYLTRDTDIHIASGTYEETVSLTRALSAATSAEMLWTGGGINTGTISKIRLIAEGTVWLSNSLTSTQPTIYVGRPNVEIYNFATIKTISTETITKTNWTDGDGGTSVHMQMPTVLFSDDYNASTLLYGAANNCKIVNCRINGGSGGGGVLNNGGNWIYVEDCLLEYCTEYGIAHVGSSKGNPCENLIRGCGFHQQTNGSDIVHGGAIILWIDDCRFWDVTPTKHLQRQTANANAQYANITNCHCYSAGELEGNNAGFDASGIFTAVEGGPLGSDDLTGDNWVSGDNAS